MNFDFKHSTFKSHFDVLLFQEVIRKDDSAKTSSAKYVNRNVIDSDTPYINAKLQDSVSISSVQYNDVNVDGKIVVIQKICTAQHTTNQLQMHHFICCFFCLDGHVDHSRASRLD